MMSLWDALRMNMMISYQELVRTFPSLHQTCKGILYVFSPFRDYLYLKRIHIVILYVPREKRTKPTNNALRLLYFHRYFTNMGIIHNILLGNYVCYRLKIYVVVPISGIHCSIIYFCQLPNTRRVQRITKPYNITLQYEKRCKGYFFMLI